MLASVVSECIVPLKVRNHPSSSLSRYNSAALDDSSVHATKRNAQAFMHGACSLLQLRGVSGLVPQTKHDRR